VSVIRWRASLHVTTSTYDVVMNKVDRADLEYAWQKVIENLSTEGLIKLFEQVEGLQDFIDIEKYTNMDGISKSRFARTRLPIPRPQKRRSPRPSFKTLREAIVNLGKIIEE
jgi:hypothetical protein